MSRDTLTGSRIRERRAITGLRQADLARQVGISASYLNLIEHNRRRIGGKLLIDIAAALGVEPAVLTEGAEAALISTLREAAADTAAIAAEVDRVDELAGRFPGWAELLASCHRRNASLERTVEALSDRLTHDPHLAASLHEVLSSAAAIRSTSSILAESADLETEWRDRFHVSLNEESARLADSSKALVRYLDESGGDEDRRGVPQEEVDAFLAAHDYHFPGLEDGSEDIDTLVRSASELGTTAARSMARGVLNQYAEDARRLPLGPVGTLIARVGADPAALVRETGESLPCILRRLAALPSTLVGTDTGLAISDASGSLVFSKPVAGFALPRLGAACPLWPLYTALTRPQVPLRRTVAQAGRSPAVFDCMAVSWPVSPPSFRDDPQMMAVMLVLPRRGDVPPDAAPVGTSCRICIRRACPSRRERSILKEEF
ncbi:helix-turn-helix transcriptional regulator [Chachezhania sediminis]|uniref:helix-turn-helix transcriptional regulator n=1 Tax=Chachezhania sediminis TaxID=2599291 RepID=UPI00131D9AED|nr:helix-turn-helix transcriptional regulator [Chachezhania sediminis]